MKLIQIKMPEESAKPCGIVGIDFGTTFSLLGHYQDEGVAMMECEFGHSLPSTVEYVDDNFVVGSRSGIKGIKRLLGSHQYEDVAASLGFTLESGKICVGGDQWLTPVEIASKIFAKLYDYTKTHWPEVHSAVISVPAYYDDAARHRTIEAASMAGFKVARIISEPTAAAYAYGLDKKCEGIYCVYDFGGGTFDVSVLSMKGGCFRVIATKGDLFLGGDDIDRAVADHIKENDLKHYAKAAKEHLSGADAFVIEGKTLLSSGELDTIAAPYISRTIGILDEVLSEANVSKIEGVILVGGSTRLRSIKQQLQDKGFKVLNDINPDEAVVYGATLRAYAIDSAANSLLLDVTPLSLGIEVWGGGVEKIISRNTAIPIVVSQTFTTYQDGQKAISFVICQGESQKIEHNRVLSRFILNNIAPAPAGTPKIKVTFAIDADGTLSVSAEDEATGFKQSVEVVPTYGMTED